MADDVDIADFGGARVPIAADEIGGKKHQRVKVQFGADGSATDVSSGDPLPVAQSGVATSAKQDTVIGHVDGIEGQLTSLAAVVDGVESSLTAIDTAARAIQAAAERLDDIVSGAGVNQTQVGGQAVDLGAGRVGAGTQRVVLPSDQAAVAVTPAGNVAHDAVDSGNPIKVGGRARTALPTAVAQDDRVDAVHDAYGRQMSAVAPLGQRVSGTANLRDTSSTTIIASPGAGLAICVTQILVVNSHVTVGTKVTIRDGTTAKVPGGAGPNFGGFNPKDPEGLFVATRDTAVTAICGTTGADVDVTVFGYLIPA